jgi:hypothetical protein
VGEQEDAYVFFFFFFRVVAFVDLDSCAGFVPPNRILVLSGTVGG